MGIAALVFDNCGSIGLHVVLSNISAKYVLCCVVSCTVFVLKSLQLYRHFIVTCKNCTALISALALGLYTKDFTVSKEHAW